MAKSIANKFGRKPGRGLRPWLLIPKVLAVCCYFGSLATILVVWFSMPQPIETIRVIHARLTVPALLVAATLGGALVVLHGPVLLRMRWLQFKVLLSIALLFVHYWLALSFRNMTTLPPIFLAIFVAVLVIWLGRHKPRLGQNIAAVYRKSPAPKESIP